MLDGSAAVHRTATVAAPPRWLGWVLAGVFAGVAAYLAATLDRQGLWNDELFTVAAVMPHRPLSDTFALFLLPDVHPPLHYLLIWAWQRVAPASDAAMRLPGLAAWLLTVAAAAFYPCRAMGSARRCAFAALAGCSFGTLYFAQEVRSYHFFALLAVVLLYEMLDLALALRDGEAPRARRLARFAAIGIVASYTHYFAFLFAGSTVLALLGYALVLGRGVVPVAATGAAVALAFAPWMAVHLSFLAGHLGGRFWIGNELLVSSLRGFVRHVFGSVVGIAAVCGLALWGAFARRAPSLRDPVPWLVVGVAAINLAVPLALSLHTPVVTGRNLTGLRIAVLLGLALPIAGLLADRRAAALLVATAVALFASFLLTQKPRPSWREPIAYVVEQTACGRREILHYSPWDGGGALLEWYLRDPRIVARDSRFDAGIAAELARLNPVGPGCDIVAMALDLDPEDASRTAAVLAPTPFNGPGYHITAWPAAVVVRRTTP